MASKIVFPGVVIDPPDPLPTPSCPPLGHPPESFLTPLHQSLQLDLTQLYFQKKMQRRPFVFIAKILIFYRRVIQN